MYFAQWVYITYEGLALFMSDQSTLGGFEVIFKVAGMGFG